MKSLLLAAMLTLGGSGARYVAPLGLLVKRVLTVDGEFDVYQIPSGCADYWRGQEVQEVSTRICRS